MADGVPILLAQAVVDSLNGTAFSPAFVAGRAYQPVFELSDLDHVVVTVVPKSVAIKPDTRTTDSYECVIDIAIQRKDSPEVTTGLDEMMALVSEVIDFLRNTSLVYAGTDYGRWVAIENNPIFVPEHLEKFRQFTSVVSVTYRVVR